MKINQAWITIGGGLVILVVGAAYGSYVSAAHLGDQLAGTTIRTLHNQPHEQLIIHTSDGPLTFWVENPALAAAILRNRKDFVGEGVAVVQRPSEGIQLWPSANVSLMPPTTRPANIAPENAQAPSLMWVNPTAYAALPTALSIQFMPPGFLSPTEIVGSLTANSQKTLTTLSYAGPEAQITGIQLVRTLPEPMMQLTRRIGS